MSAPKLTAAQRRTLAYVSLGPQLCTAVDISPFDNVNALIGRGLIEDRWGRNEDGPEVRLYITPAGRAALEGAS